ncbi:MAG: Uncharacterised protein [Hyphomonas sp. TMED17]|nr:MAG: Uncharacterised protein [Hyphomonas sp. TMED17]
MPAPLLISKLFPIGIEILLIGEAEISIDLARPEALPIIDIEQRVGIPHQFWCDYDLLGW